MPRIAHDVGNAQSDVEVDYGPSISRRRPAADDGSHNGACRHCAAALDWVPCHPPDDAFNLPPERLVTIDFRFDTNDVIEPTIFRLRSLRVTLAAGGVFDQLGPIYDGGTVLGARATVLSSSVISGQRAGSLQCSFYSYFTPGSIDFSISSAQNPGNDVYLGIEVPLPSSVGILGCRLRPRRPSLAN